MVYHLYTDGACQPNPGNGGWAFILYPEGHEHNRLIKHGYVEKSTNNIMEITAVLNGLKAASQALQVDKSKPTIKLFSDSTYILNGIEQWMHTWVQNNWIKKDKKPVMHVDLWKQIYKLDQKLNIVCKHIKGHSGNPENEECDRLAVKEIHANRK